MKCLSLLVPCPRSWRLAPRALRERLECSEGGNTGRRAHWPYRISLKGGRPFSSQPGSTERAGYTRIRPKKASSGRPRAPAMGGLLQSIGEFDREVGAFADLAGGDRAGVGGLAHLVERFQQAVEIFRQQLLAERRVAAGARKVLCGHQIGHPAALSTISTGL